MVRVGQRSKNEDIGKTLHFLVVGKKFLFACAQKKGLAMYGMEMNVFKYLGWGVLMVLVQKRNPTSRCLKLHTSVSQFFGTKCTHSRVPGIKGEALFSKLFFGMSANHKSVQIRILICIIRIHRAEELQLKHEMMS